MIKFDIDKIWNEINVYNFEYIVTKEICRYLLDSSKSENLMIKELKRVSSEIAKQGRALTQRNHLGKLSETLDMFAINHERKVGDDFVQITYLNRVLELAISAKATLFMEIDSDELKQLVERSKQNFKGNEKVTEALNTLPKLMSEFEVFGTITGNSNKR